MKATSQLLKKSGGGGVVNVSSVFGIVGRDLAFLRPTLRRREPFET